ncbi:glycine betaine ABC transporter substrate-binding protein, partial [Paraburkholderia sp. SIMBA_054]|uniref:glycine betaine ABC transporter substrate-binding protein n=1 Tax=Paraburkholderia sp. SIMBA_054 TaxID=3085795 RepID=UPI00397D8917
VLRSAQENGQVDVYWEYTGTSLITYNKINDRLSPEDTYRKVKELDAGKGLVWLDPSRANNTYSFAMNQDEAKKLGIATLSDLAKAIK